MDGHWLEWMFDPAFRKYFLSFSSYMSSLTNRCGNPPAATGRRSSVSFTTARTVGRFGISSKVGNLPLPTTASTSLCKSCSEEGYSTIANMKLVIAAAVVRAPASNRVPTTYAPSSSENPHFSIPAKNVEVSSPARHALLHTYFPCSSYPHSSFLHEHHFVISGKDPTPRHTVSSLHF